jgi:hypothetical protein
MEIGGMDLRSVSQEALLGAFVQHVLPRVAPAVTECTRARDISTTIGASGGSGGATVSGGVTFTWKCPPAKEGSASVTGSVGTGGNWSVGGSVTVHF